MDFAVMCACYVAVNTPMTAGGEGMVCAIECVKRGSCRARFEAMLETAELLLLLLLAHPAPPSPGAWNPGSNPVQGSCEPAAGLAAAASPTGAFLAGGAGVPAELLARVPPALLARLARGLLPPPDAPVLPVRAGGLTEEAPVRRAARDDERGRLACGPGASHAAAWH